MTHFISRFSERKNWVILTQKIESFWPKKLSHFDPKNWVIWPKNLGQILVLPVFQFFLVKMTYFSLNARCNKIESFWLKNLGQIFVLPVIEFFRSKWLIFSLSKRKRKIESFWPKNLGQILVPPVIQFFRSKWFIFFLSVHEAKKIESFWPKKFGSIGQRVKEDLSSIWVKEDLSSIWVEIWPKNLGQILVPPI